MNTHLLIQGGWAECTAGEKCNLRFHFDMSAEEACAIPMSVIYPMLEIMDPPTVETDGVKQWLNNMGQRHREYDLPAYVNGDGMGWQLYGLPYARPNDQPSWIRNGDLEWHDIDGLNLHREGDLPAVIHKDGGREWFRHGYHWRENDQPSVIRPNGRQEWYIRNQLGRQNDLPAVINPDGSRVWYEDHRIHREGAPAIIDADGGLHWYLYEQEISPWEALGVIESQIPWWID